MSATFRIMRGPEANLLAKPFVDGYVYVAVDTKRIYMDTYFDNAQQNKLPIGGGNSGIYYASKTFTDSSDLSFSIDDIEGKELPDVNDLIINYKSKNETRDGFYKVVSTNPTTNTVDVEYLPVGGGGGGTSSSSGGEIKIIPITNTTGTTTKEQGYSIEYAIEAYNNAGAAVITPGKALFTINGEQVDGGQVLHGGKYKFNVGPYLSTIKETNVITLKVTLNTGGIVDDTQTFTWTVKCVDLKLIWDWNYSSKNYIKEKEFVLSWKVSGGVECVTHISVDGGSNPDVDYFTVNLSSSQYEGSKTLKAFPYGAHKFTMWVTARIGEITISTDKIEHVLTFIGGNDTSPILTVPYFTKNIRQYDTIRIPFLVYRPGAEKLKVTFYIDNIDILTEEYETTSDTPHYWPYTLGRAGEVTIKIVATNYPEIYYETTLQVAPLDLGITEPSEGKAFFLKASDISGNAQLKQLEQNGQLTFSSNFDWVNGGLQSEVDANGNVSNYICVRQGTTMTINYKLFANSQVSTQGKTFKFCFKAMNCYDYEAPVLECYEENTKRGLKFTAQSATFSSGANPNFATQYCEGSYIELETEIWPDQADNDLTHRPGDRFLMFWVDGVPAGVEIFDKDEIFTQNNPRNITIGSNQCDVYVYIVKIYERRLSSLEHLNNFILDAPNITEKLARFERNDILGSNNEISYEKLVTKNPGCHAYLYQLTENGMTTNKEDEKDCNYTEYYLTSDKPCLTAKNAKVFVQGTSSAAYGVAAFNVRTDFGDTTMYDGDGNVVEGRKVSETSIPVDYTCTKVNVASCENVNNALNAEWYHRYQPYWDGHRRKSTATKEYRDCMEFDFGVMFVEDHNKNTNYKNADGKPDKSLYTSTNVFAYNTNGELDTNYVNNPYYKQYAVANMGNDKKNLEVFHDIKNPRACCVEVLDNQNAEHWMTKIVTTDDFVWSDEDDGFYEFRYSVKKCKAEDKQGITEQAQAQAFIDFVNWMASCDPNPYNANSHPNGYTGAKLPADVTYGKKIFTGFTPEGWDDSTSTGITLAGFETERYAGTYTHDTKEYRIAKMLHECEEHMVMDSVVYHYLFIQRHTMVDNVAKNTFWSTEDLQHWDLTKNYDNDTSDGNDNSGYLRYSYGKEILDKREDGADVFNASDSVWLNFIFNIPDVQENLYGKLLNRKINGVGVWDAAGYLKLFKEKQALIPERCWIDDYFRKYLRPRRLGLDGDKTFIQRLEGGLKTHQRQQFENYQGYYIDSKYCAGASFNDTGSFDMRLNKGPAIYQLTTDTSVIDDKIYFEKKLVTDDSGASWEDYVQVIIADTSINPSELDYYEIVSGGWQKTEKFPTSYYINLYPSAKIGGQLWRSPVRLIRGQTIDIPVGQILDAPTDATCYIYAANMIQTIKGIADTYPNYLGISSASKLRELEAGSAITGYFNDKLNNAVLNQNTQLEKAQLQQVGSDQLSGLDLSNLAMLKELKINLGSTFPSLKLAKGSIINTLYLNPLTTLNVKDLQLLSDFQYDHTAKHNIFDTLTTVCIQNCPALNDFSYELVKKNVITNYCFNDINWQASSTDMDIDTGEILVLENLLQENKQPYEVATQSLALTGTLTIDLAYSLANESVKEYDIYFNYKKEFPNLNIEYSGNTEALKPAQVITFYKDYDPDTNTYGDIFYQVKTNGSKTLNWLISDAGPTGSAILTPTKDSDQIFDYEWLGTWKDETGKEFNFNDVDIDYIPTTSKKFVAQYKKEYHQYTVTLRDYDGSDIVHDLETYSYGTDISNLMPFYLYRPHPTEGMRYEFQGWISAEDYLGNHANPEIITEFIIEKDTTYYAFYKEQNCNSVVSRLDYFEFSGDGFKINLNDKYRYLIQEPITLPLFNGDKPITTIGDFGVYYDQNGIEKVKIPSIYFLNGGIGGSYTNIESYAFWSAAQGATGGAGRVLLKHIYLPATIQKIGGYAFIGCQELETINLPDASKDDDIGITELGTYAFNSTGKIKIDERTDYKPLAKLKTVGVAVFYAAGNGVYLSEMPKLLTAISPYTFSGCPNVAIEDYSKVISLGQNAFEGCGKNTSIDLILPTSLSGFANNCFYGYAKNNINTVTYVGGGTVDDTELSRLGLSYSNPVTIEQVIA